MAKKGAMPVYKTMDDYISNQSPQAQQILQTLRSMVQETIPNAHEVENYKVPVFVLVPENKSNHQLMFAAYAKYVSFYPGSNTVTAFLDPLGTFKTGKGSVQFPLDQPLPKELIIKMLRYRQQELLDAIN